VTRDKVLTILTGWIAIAKAKQLTGKAAKFWVLRDYADGGVWSPQFYKRHAFEALDILMELDKTKAEARGVYDYLLPVIKESMK